MKHRILAMLVAVSMLFQCVSMTVFAAEVSGNESTVSDNDVAVEQQPEDVSEEVAAVDIEEVNDENNESSESNETFVEEETTVSENIGEIDDREVLSDSTTKSYWVDNTYTLSNISVTPKSYHANVGFDVTTTLNMSPSVYFIFTTDVTVAADFFPEVTYVTINDLLSDDYYYTSVYDYVTTNWENEDGVYSYRMDGILMDNGGFKPNTTYYYRMAYYEYDYVNQESVYHFLTAEPQSFTTSAPIEKSAVTIASVIDESGYAQLKAVWTVENPNDEKIVYGNFECTDSKGETWLAYANQGYDNNGNLADYYHAELFDAGESVTGTPQVSVYTGANEATAVKATESITLKYKDINDADIQSTLSVGINSFSLRDISIRPFYSADNGEIIAKLYYRKKGTEDIWKFIETGVYETNNMITVSSLEEGTEYEYYLSLHREEDGQLLWSSEATPATCKTKEIVTYEDSAFPDEIFRKCIKETIGIEETEKITSDKLDTIQYLSLNWESQYENLNKPIESIEGIQYLTNLEQFYIDGHNLKNADALSELTLLREVGLYSNDLTSMPDLSKLSNLYWLSLNGNCIDPDEIVESKFHKNFLDRSNDWLQNTKVNQRKELSYKLAPKYYAIGETSPFIMKVDGIKWDRNYTVCVTVEEDVKIYSDEFSGGNRMVVVEDTGLEPGTYTATITIEDEYGINHLELTDQELVFVEDEAVATTMYVESDDFTVYGDILLGGHYSSDEIENIEVLDKNGTVVGAIDSSYMDISTSYDNEYRYDAVFDNYYIDLQRSVTTIWGEYVFAKYLTGGMYDIKVTTSYGEIMMIEDAIECSDKPIIYNVYLANGSYDCVGDYLYVQVNSVNLDPTKIRPVFYDGTQDMTKLINVQPEGTGYLYKLKKIDKSQWIDEMHYDYRFDVQDEYEYIDKLSKHRMYYYIWHATIYQYYNWREEVYEAFFDSQVPNGTNVTVSLCRDYEGTDVYATASSVVKDGKIAVQFKDLDGEVYAPENGRSTYVKYEFTGAFESVECESEYIYWMDYYEDYNYNYTNNVLSNIIMYYEEGVKTLELDIYVRESIVSDGKSYAAEVCNTYGVQQGEDVVLTRNGTETLWGEKYVRFTGTWTSDTGLTKGQCPIFIVQDDEQIGVVTLEVYDNNTFYLNNLYGDWNDSEVFYLNFASPQLQGNYIHKYGGNVSSAEALTIWKDEYDLTIYDKLGNEITGWEVTSAEYPGYSFGVNIKNLNKNCIGYYFKLVHKKNGEPISFYSGMPYYVDGNDMSAEYGKYVYNDINSCSFVTYTSEKAICGLIIGEDIEYPITLTFRKPYETDPIKAITISAKPAYGTYYFTTSDLSGINPKEVYEAVAVTANGNFSMSTGYFAPYSEGEIIAATGITLNKTSLTMDVGAQETLKATVKPVNVTNSSVTWSSSNSDVVNVDSWGTVTAISAGTAEITATTHNGKTAKCTVKVFDYSLNMTDVTLDIAKNETVSLKVSDGIAQVSSITFVSDNLGVASVDKNGLVTPKSSGVATITASMKNGPSFSCVVTVVNNVLHAISLRDKNLTLNVGDTEALKLYYTPDDTTLSKNVEWTSSVPTVVTVEDGMVTALAKGKAVVTAKVGTLTASCEITVKEVVSLEDIEIPTLHAITNIQPTLSAVELPTAQWKWKDGTIALQSFTGVQEKEFVAIYTKDADTAPIEISVPVALSTIKKVSLQADTNKLLVGDTTNVYTVWEITGEPVDMSAFDGNGTWASSKAAVAETVKTENGVQINAVSKGSAKISFNTIIGGKAFSAQYTVTVVEGDASVITVDSITGFTQDTLEATHYSAELSLAQSTLNVKATNTATLTVKSGTPGVITVGKLVADGEDFTIPLTLKSVGVTKLTITANDPLKTTKEIYLYVTDETLNLSTTSITLNTLKTVGEVFYIHANKGYSVNGTVQLAGADGDKFVLIKETEENAYSIMPKDTTVKGKYTVTVKVGEKACVEPLKIQVVTQEPKVTLKQYKKVNLFYAKDSGYGDGYLNVTTAENLETITLENCENFELTGHVVSKITPKTDGLSTKCNKTGVVVIKLEGYKPIKKQINIGVESKKPALTLNTKTATLYPVVGVESANVTLVEKVGSVKYGVDLDDISVSLKDGDGYIVEKDDDTIVITRTDSTKNKSAKMKLVLNSEAWSAPMEFAFTMKVNTKQPAIKLDSKSIHLNMNSSVAAYDTATVNVSWKDATEALEIENISVGGANATADAVVNKGIVFAQNGSTVIARLNDVSYLKKGTTYKFNVQVKTNGGYIATTPLSVKIEDVAEAKAVKVATKGTIDVFDRAFTNVVCTPALKSVNGEIVDVTLSGASAHLFFADYDNNGTVFIFADPYAALISKYKYSVNLEITLQNAEGETFTVTTSPITLKLKQGKPKVTITPKESVYYSGAGNNIKMDISAVLNNRKVVIEDVQLTNNTNLFELDYSDGKITLSGNKNAVKGKSYTLKFKVSLAGRADNENDLTVSYKVKVK